MGSSDFPGGGAPHGMTFASELDVRDLRHGQRYATAPPLPAEFSGRMVVVLDVSIGGMQLEHVSPLKPGLSGTLRVPLRAEYRELFFAAEVVWSHLSPVPDDEGNYLYRTGVKIDGMQFDTQEALEHLMTRFGHPDERSLLRKLEALRAREHAIAHRAGVRVVHTGPRIPDDVVLEVFQALDRLRSHPDEALRWYNRAKFSLTETGKSVDELQFHHKEDVLAVWEYLERTVEVDVISKVFEARR